MSGRRRRAAFELTLLLALGALGAAGCDPDPWDRKDAHSYCSAMLNQRPGAPKHTCRAVGVCANEATLTPDERAKLSAMIKRLGCTPP